MKISNIFYKLATSKQGQKLYKWLCDPNKRNFYNNTLPTIETGVVTGFYCYNTAKRKDIPKDQKALLQWQNVLGGIAGIGIGSYCNRKATKFVDELSNRINPDIIDVHKLKTGLAVGIPIAITALIMRLFIPIVSAQLSVEVEKHRRKKEKQQLNTVA